MKKVSCPHAEIESTRERIQRPIFKWLESSTDTSLILSGTKTRCEKVGVFAGLKLLLEQMFT